MFDGQRVIPRRSILYPRVLGYSRVSTEAAAIVAAPRTMVAHWATARPDYGGEMDARDKKIEEAAEILRALGLQKAQQGELSCLTLLALCQLSFEDPWRSAERKSMTLNKGIMAFLEGNLSKAYATNSREQFRKSVLLQFRQAGIVDYNPDNPKLPTTSPLTHYATNSRALEAIRSFGSEKWEEEKSKFLKDQPQIVAASNAPRDLEQVKVTLPDGTELALSPGDHNYLQAAVVESFLPRFAPDAKLMYLGDTDDKTKVFDQSSLDEIGLPLNEHDKLPDVILYDEKTNRLILVEAVIRRGPVDSARFTDFEAMTAGITPRTVYVTAFLSRKEFKKHLESIAWETEVWIADQPDHLIHLNGGSLLDR